MTDGPLFAYRERRNTGTLKDDPAQELAAEKLQGLHHALKSYRPQGGRGSWRARLGLARQPAVEPLQGLYLVGPVGRGKSMLMDLFFRDAPLKEKRRVHFNDFMLEVHETLHRWRTEAGGRQERDPIERFAEDLAARTWLLCFDEFQVENIADAMILGRLFAAMFERGVVVVATSNTAPVDLYKDGLQRERFLPFIELISQRLDVLDLGPGADFRREMLHGIAVYHTPADSAATAALEDALRRLGGEADPEPTRLLVQGRTLNIPRAVNGAAAVSFAELCEKPLGAADYIALATRFHTLVLSDVPVLGPDDFNEARRFVTLIDALYEHRVKLICSAAAAPDALCPEGRAAAAFRRTASRLIEMQSEAYIAAEHLT